MVEQPGLSVGIDVVDIEDFSATLDRSGAQFISDVFTTGEIAYCKNRRPQHYSVRWAAKEAFFKATNGSLPADATYRDVEITPDARGVPQLRLSGAAARWAREVGLRSSSVSLSHSRRTSMAAVILRFRSQPPLARGARQLLQRMMLAGQRLLRARARAVSAPRILAHWTRLSKAPTARFESSTNTKGEWI